MNLTNVTINVSRNAKKTLTPEEQKQNEFMKMSLTKKMEFIYNMLMDHEDRIIALEPETEPDPTTDPTADPTTDPTTDPDPKPLPDPIPSQTKFEFESFGDEKGNDPYGTGTVETTNTVIGDYIEVMVLSNSYDENLPDDQKFVNKLFYVDKNATPDNKTLYQLYVNTNGNLEPIGVWVKIKEYTNEETPVSDARMSV